MDIYLFSAITNIIWYAFTILFLLYRFTTFFSWIWNFLIFMSNLVSCFKWLGNKMTYIYQYYYKGYRPPFDLEENPYEPLLDKNEKSMIMRVKDNIVGFLPPSWINKKEDNEELYELYISELNTVPKFTKKSKSQTHTNFEHVYFNSNMDMQFSTEWTSSLNSNSESNLLLESKFINSNNKKNTNNTTAILEIEEIN